MIQNNASPQDELSRRKQTAEENVRLNEKEFQERKIVLQSTPQNIFVQINAVCNANCVFCSKGYDYPLFRLDEWLGRYGEKVTPVLSRARQVILTGSGELLGLSDAPRILDYFNSEFPYVEKFLATNGSYLTPKIIDKICAGGSRYVIQLSLHAGTPATHRVMMRYGAYDRVQENIRALLAARKREHVQVICMFILTTLNVDELPDFVRYAAKLGADKVACGYFYIYESNQKYLSLFFRQEQANKRIDEARLAAQEVGIDFQAPPKFGLAPEVYRKPDCCQEPWYQLMLSLDGHVLPCDVYGNFPREDNLNDKSFMEVWNGAGYVKLRKALVENGGCIAHCPRHNPGSVNEWNSHVIRRFKDERQIVKEHKESLRRP